MLFLGGMGALRISDIKADTRRATRPLKYHEGHTREEEEISLAMRLFFVLFSLSLSLHVSISRFLSHFLPHSRAVRIFSRDQLARDLISRVSKRVNSPPPPFPRALSIRFIARWCMCVCVCVSRHAHGNIALDLVRLIPRLDNFSHFV